MRKLFKKGVTILLAAAMVFGLSGMTAFAAESEVLSEDGYGTAAIADANSYEAKYDWYVSGTSPYRISEPEELAGLSDIVNGTAEGIPQDSFVGKTVELTEDLDMNADGAVEWSYSTYEAGGTSGVTPYTAVSTEVTVAADAKAFTPIGNMTFTASGTVSKGSAFLGTFDGGGHEIRNLYVTGGKGEYLGLFGTVGGVDPVTGESYGTVENFTLTGVIYHTATTTPARGTDDELADFVGAACGKLNAGGTIQGVISEMDVEAPNAFNVGGIVGFAGTPNGMDYSSNPSRDNTHVLCCANRGEAVFGYNFVGGVVGENAATVKYCCNNAWVFNHNSGSKGSYGGVIGMNSSGNNEESVAAYCYNTGTVSNNGRPDYGATSRYFGGVAGWAHAGEKTNEIYNSYNIGDIPEGYAGGSDRSGFASITAGMEAGLPEVTNRNNYSLDSDAIHNDAGTTLQQTGIKVSEDDFKLSSYNVGDILTNLGHYFVPDETGEINDGYPVLWWEAGASLPAITGLRVTEEPDKTVYNVGETFDPTGMEVVAEYENGVRELVIPKEVTYNEEAYELDDGYTYDHKELRSGMGSVTITYTNGEGDTVTTEQPIHMEGDSTPVELLITPPNKTEYIEGQTFDPAGMTFTVVFDNGSEASLDVSDVEIPTAPLELGQTSVTIRYTLGDVTVSAEQEITVVEQENVDKTALQAEYDEDSQLVEEDYTADSWETFATALEDAKTVLDNALVTQGEVDDALAALQSAKAGLEEAVYGDITIYKDGEFIAAVTGEQYKELQADAPVQTFKMYRGDTENYTEVTAHFVLVSDLLDENQPDEGCGVNLNDSRPWPDMENLYLYYKTETGSYCQAVDGTPGYAGWLDDIVSITLGHEYVDGVCAICGKKEAEVKPTVSDVSISAVNMTGNEKTYDGENVTLTVSATVDPEDAEVTCQWSKDGTPMEGATKESVTLAGSVTDSGTYTCMVTAANSAGSDTGSGDFTLTINKADQDISYEQSSVTKYDYDETFTNPLTITTADPADGSGITYASSDETVATVDGDGKVTITGPGTTTITATAQPTDNYNADTASYVLTVNEVDKSALEEAVTEAETLNSGDYTPESWQPFEAALKDAQDVLADPTAAPEDVADALDALQTAKDNLEPAVTPTPVPEPLQGLNKVNGVWGYYVDGEVDTNYTGFAHNENGDWYVVNGYIRFDQNTVAKDTTGKNGDKGVGAKGDWWYVVNNKVQDTYTGVANHKNDNGWWYVVKGKVDFTHTGVEKNNNGWWYVTGGKVDFNHNGVDKNSNGWWYIVGGKVQFGYTGVGNYSNSNGWWYIKGGKVDFSANTVARNNNGWWLVEGGKVNFNYTGVANYKNANGWWYVKNGKVDFSYNGTAKNKNGTWNVVNGKVRF